MQAAKEQLIVPALSNAEEKVWFSLIIPTYNERENLSALLTQITRALSVAYDGRYEIIIVDDDSPDGTGNEARRLNDQYPQLKVISRTAERGLATAVIRGWQQASGSVLGVIDADLQHPPMRLVDLLSAIERGADLAIASRYIEQGSTGDWGVIRRTLSNGAGMLAACLLPEVVGHVKDPLSGYFVVRRTALEGVALHPQGYKILLEVLVRGRAKHVVEIPFDFALRQHGQTKATFKQGWEYILHLLSLRWFLWQ
jgi:dolichol-phosphate mannosyltransferase